MNRKQWFVFGIGLILLYIFYVYMGLITDCSDLSESYSDLLEKSVGTEVDITGSTLILLDCFHDNLAYKNLSTISFSFGVLLIICGFLEPKKK